MANLPPKPSLGMPYIHAVLSQANFNLIDAPISPNQQQSLVHHQPNFAHSQTNFPPNQMHHVPRQPIFAQSQSNFSLNQPNFARPQPNFARSQPKFPHNQFPHNQFPHNQPNLAHRQPSFAHRQPNFPSTQPNRPSPSELPPHGQQQHLSPSNQIVLRGHPQSLDQSLISDPSLPHYPTSTNSYHFPPSSYPPLSPNSFSRILPPASRPAHSNHPQFSNQHQQQHQQQQHHSRTSSQDSLLTCNPSLMRVPQIVPAGANRRVTFSTSAADAARRQGAMQDNFTPANEDGPSSFNSNREIHNAIRQVHETLNVMRNEMVAMHEQVHQNMYTLHRETHAMHESNNGSIERVIKMLNYS